MAAAPDCRARSTTANSCDRLAPNESKAPALTSVSIVDRLQAAASTRSQKSNKSLKGAPRLRAAAIASAAPPPQPLIADKAIDFVRMHISQMGGLTPARDVALFANMYGIRTAWHGPGDTSPVGHAANLHLDVWAPNFGVQEWCRFPELVYDMFPGLPEVRNGYMYPNDNPGLGIDIDEKLAAKYPCQDTVEAWTQTRLPDGSPTRP